MHGAQDVILLEERFTDEAIAFAIRIDDADFLNWLNAFLTGLRADGRNDKPRSTWFESTDRFDLDR